MIRRSVAQLDADLRQAQADLAALRAQFEALVAHYAIVTEKANHAHLFACVVNREGLPLRPEYGEPYDDHHLAPIPAFEG